MEKEGYDDNDEGMKGRQGSWTQPCTGGMEERNWPWLIPPRLHQFPCWCHPENRGVNT